MLLLFDIDGTLMHNAAVAHAAALREALRAVHRVYEVDGRVDPAGKTDYAIVRQLLLLADITAKDIDKLHEAVRDEACNAFARLCPEDLSHTVVPGAVDALKELGGAGHHLSLVTGNFEPIARLKLTRGGLGEFFAHGEGAFGSDHEDRTALPPLARQRAGRLNAPHPRRDTVVIGDTPLDIACARSDAVKVVAVTTGKYSALDLVDADVVVDSVAHVPEALVSLSA
jgi:phosphoglycolate phosphatase